MKKILFAAALLAVTTSSYAYFYMMPANYPMSAQKQGSRAYGYIQGLAGWDHTNAINASTKLSGATYDHPNGGLAGGVDAGVNFLPNIGIESGFLMLFQKTKNHANNGELSKWYSIYASGRFSMNINKHFDVYALAGMAYTSMSVKGKPFNRDPGAVTLKDSNSAFVPMGGVGADWVITQHILLGARYVYISSQLSTPKPFLSKPQIFAQQYFLATLGYKFAV